MYLSQIAWETWIRTVCLPEKKVHSKESECPLFLKNVSFSSRYTFYVRPVVSVAGTGFVDTCCLASGSWFKVLAEIGFWWLKKLNVNAFGVQYSVSAKMFDLVPSISVKNTHNFFWVPSCPLYKKYICWKWSICILAEKLGGHIFTAKYVSTKSATIHEIYLLKVKSSVVRKSVQSWSMKPVPEWKKFFVQNRYSAPPLELL